MKPPLSSRGSTGTGKATLRSEPAAGAVGPLAHALQVRAGHWRPPRGRDGSPPPSRTRPGACRCFAHAACRWSRALAMAAAHTSRRWLHASSVSVKKAIELGRGQAGERVRLARNSANRAKGDSGGGSRFTRKSAQLTSALTVEGRARISQALSGGACAAWGVGATAAAAAQR